MNELKKNLKLYYKPNQISKTIKYIYIIFKFNPNLTRLNPLTLVSDRTSFIYLIH